LSEEQLAARQRLLLEVNANIGADAQDFSADFLCECGDGECLETVHLTLAGYEQLRAAGGFVLAIRHVVQRAEMARAWARSLASDAAALRAQAELQQKRARENLGA
jgi:hypothetical protein